MTVTVQQTLKPTLFPSVELDIYQVIQPLNKGQTVWMSIPYPPGLADTEFQNSTSRTYIYIFYLTK
ncbi:hypothetical protein DPMN_100872 [Dreissena polymorpha]|uniref:Uncharacterized protein n=1 Tax=Dreissena polymorpha TaxID=45954 RepID=A0A9D4LIY5_DREPO|nr:hypothetical protein DPMN_100872 [Dreissena polymorpha]